MAHRAAFPPCPRKGRVRRGSRVPYRERTAPNTRDGPAHTSGSNARIGMPPSRWGRSGRRGRRGHTRRRAPRNGRCKPNSQGRTDAGGIRRGCRKPSRSGRAGTPCTRRRRRAGRPWGDRNFRKGDSHTRIACRTCHRCMREARWAPKAPGTSCRTCRSRSSRSEGPDRSRRTVSFRGGRPCTCTRCTPHRRRTCSCKRRNGSDPTSGRPRTRSRRRHRNRKKCRCIDRPHTRSLGTSRSHRAERTVRTLRGRTRTPGHRR